MSRTQMVSVWSFLLGLVVTGCTFRASERAVLIKQQVEEGRLHLVPEGKQSNRWFVKSSKPIDFEALRGEGVIPSLDLRPCGCGDLTSVDAELTQISQALSNNSISDAAQVPMMHLLEAPASWGLDRIDQPVLPLDKVPFHHGFLTSGRAVDVYVVDTGVRPRTPELSHVDEGMTFLPSGRKANTDCEGDGHGTQIAGTIAAIAREVAIHPVAVAECGTPDIPMDRVIQGIDWVIRERSGKTSVAILNLSIGGPSNKLLDCCVRKAVEANIIVVVAAGNDGMDAGLSSPSGVDSAVVVGALRESPKGDVLDRPANWSNFGPSVDFYAPGESLVSISAIPDEAHKYAHDLNGTSFAASHVSGVAALWAGHGATQKPPWSRQQIEKAIGDAALSRRLLSGTVIRIARTGAP